MKQRFLQTLGVSLPILQAPMAGISSPAMAAAVSAAGGLGALAIGAMGVAQARDAIGAFKRACARPLNVNVFVHRAPVACASREVRWLDHLRPEFERWRARPPEALRSPYVSFLHDAAMCAMLVEERPRVVSFHFGLPDQSQIEALRSSGIVLIATATNLAEAQAIERAGLDAIVAQGVEAGGHRGVFDPDADDLQLGIMALTRLLAQNVSLPIIAAGGIMDGAGIAAALALGACAAQLGTAFVATDESLADAAYRERLLGSDACNTVITRAISGRPARGLPNDFTRLGATIADADIPDYPLAYHAGKALHAAAMAAGYSGYGAHWAGQGAPLARTMSAGSLVRTLAHEMMEACDDVCVANRQGELG
ncbi:NAD(P)H-dependent flavin oxidoreductase [Lysobacter solisilvae (ex Woo and Kim 2020)]|uniref:Nitronate monooxygenase n=1 Tax=Agrilutibacter terrestris TaxID=2865112 RepID=A0A7H0FXL9_9GAMM|nr:nitronate monooxygenase [Lysobacter terrestris]QNP40785.1 nitronate monooxygenase [Lysobacter terrestris]